jgi:CHAD domain-containing protein
MRALKRDEKVHDAIQLIVQKSTHASVALLSGGRDSTLTDEVIHDLRKQVKTLRSLLKLVRADMGRLNYRRAIRCLREASLRLSDVRDAKVVLTNCDRLTNRCAPLDTARMRLHAVLAGRLEEARVRIAASPGRRRTIAGKLQTAERLVTAWRAPQGPWKNLSRGLRTMYVKGGAALKKAAADKSDANLHELRKRAKDLLYTCEFLRDAGSRVRSLSADLKRFTDLLGKHHDLVVLQHAVGAEQSAGEGSFCRQLAKLASHEQTSLRNRAWKIGLRIYDEPAAAFVSRVHRDWKAWRHS